LPGPKASPRIPSALYLIASLIEVARGAFRVVLLRGGIPEERHQPVPDALQQRPDKADHGLRTAFMKRWLRGRAATLTELS
jgi:hypothetical protein